MSQQQPGSTAPDDDGYGRGEFGFCHDQQHRATDHAAAPAYPDAHSGEFFYIS
jgi:hypothetical protein